MVTAATKEAIELGALPPTRCPKNKEARQEWVDRIMEIRSRLGFSPGSRGWGYLLEGELGLTKDLFSKLSTVMGEMRKAGELPLDIVDPDELRKLNGVEVLDYADPKEEADWILGNVTDWVDGYSPRSAWEDQETFLVVAVEKMDLVKLFTPVCEKYRVPIYPVRGWGDVDCRGKLIKLCDPHIKAGRRVVVLYCGDFDPGGLRISDRLSQNLLDLDGAYYSVNEVFQIELEEGDIEIDRFGLNYDFINDNKLSWVDNLTTSGKTAGGKPRRLDDTKHPDFTLDYVQDYLRDYCGGYPKTVNVRGGRGEYYVTDSPRKVEANALIVEAEMGRNLCEDAILKYLDNPHFVTEFEESLAPERAKLRKLTAALLRKKK